MSRDSVRLLTGSAALGLAAALVVGAVVLFRGGATPTASVTVLSPRVGLIMNPDAKVKLHGAQVGKVAAIENRPDGSAAISLAMNPDYLQLIPANTRVQIVSSTVFGAKYVDLVPPAESICPVAARGTGPRRRPRHRRDQHGLRAFGGCTVPNPT